MEIIKAEPITESPPRAPGPIFDESWLTSGRFAILLGLLVVATFPGVVFGSATFVIRDFGLFSFPVAHFQRESFWHGELPFWNPLSECGVPFLAQWNTMPLYPPALFYLVLPLSWGLPMFCLAHLFWGGLGTYHLARSWTGSRLAAALAGVIFSFNGLTLNFLMWPSHIATFSWLPWVLWLVPAAWRQGGSKMLWGTLAASLQMLAGGPETIALTWIILLMLVVGDLVREPGRRLRVAGCFVAVPILVSFLCAPQLLPFLELLKNSQRDTGFGSSVWSMPAWGWASFLVPLFHTAPSQGVFFQSGQSWTSSYYAGIGTVFLAAVSLRRARAWPMPVLVVAAFAGLVLALGDGGLLFLALRKCVPALGFVRYPVKFVILVLAVAPLLAAFGLQTLMTRTQRMGSTEAGIAAGVWFCIGAIIVVAWKFPSSGEDGIKTAQNGLARAAVLLLIFIVTADLLKSVPRRRALLGCILIASFWLDLVTHVPAQNPTAPPSIYTSSWAAANLNWNPRPQLGQSRAMLGPAALDPLKYHVIPDLRQNYLLQRLALLADCNLLDDTPQVHGFFSLLPAHANNVITLLYMQTNRDFPSLLDFLGVSQTTSPPNVFEWKSRPTAMPLVTCGQQPIFTDDQSAWGNIFATNIDFGSVVLLPAEAGSMISATQHTAQVLASEFGRQNISIQAEASTPAMLVISQSYYPAWKAYVDGFPTKLWRANYAFQALQIPAGKHQVRLLYEDNAFRIGTMFCGVGVIACASIWVSSRRRDLPNSA